MVKKVIVEGVFYDKPAKEVAKELGIHYSTLMSRINSNSKKYKNWTVSDLDFKIIINNKNYANIDSAIFALLNLKKRIHETKCND